MSKNILLFPGGFKPFHDGHLSILKSHIFNIDNVHIDEVRIYISSKNRDNITADSSLWFLNNIKGKLSELYNVNINVGISEYPAPIRKCYNDVGNSTNNDKFCLVTSNKGNDIKRKDEFVQLYSENGKYYDLTKGVKTIYINANIEPIHYINRCDEYNNECVSSTIIRNDIYNHNYDMFKTAYINMLSNNNILDEKILKKYYEKLIDLS